jgi:hypothetical protein
LIFSAIFVYPYCLQFGQAILRGPMWSSLTIAYPARGVEERE